MFCPGCGIENQNDLAYCQSCGNDLKIISQVMKKHLPVSIISKLDAVIEQDSARLQRNAILNFFLGIASLICGGFSETILSGSIFYLLGVGAIIAGVWDYLAYFRSFELKERDRFFEETAELSSASLLKDALLSGNGAESAKLIVEKNLPLNPSLIYCVYCGAENQENLSFCRACGGNLVSPPAPSGLEKYLPAFILNKLDGVIEKNKSAKPSYKDGSTIFIVAMIFLVNMVLQLIAQRPATAALYFVLGASVFITNSWDFLAYRRKLEQNNSLSDQRPPSESPALREYLLTPANKFRAVVTALLFIAGIPLIWFGVAGGWVVEFLAVVMAIAFGLKIRQFLSEKNKAHLNNNAVFSTKELETPDTRLLTTAGIPEIDQADIKQEVTTRKLIEPEH